MNTRITIERLMAWKPCRHNYPRKRIVELFAGRTYVTPRGVHNAPIPLMDRIWVLGELLAEEDSTHFSVLHRNLWIQYPENPCLYSNGNPNAQQWFYAELLRIFGIVEKLEAANVGTALADTTKTTKGE